MSRALVTGGAGFLGSHLCERLVREGHDVVCVDDLSTGTRENVAALEELSSFRFWRHDVTEPFDEPVDLVFNLASPASPQRYQQDPLQTLRTNTVGVLNVLELADRHGARLVQASTSEIYGDPEVHPQREDYWGNVDPLGPRACYTEAKRCAETLTIEFHRQRHVDVKLMRIFNTYGPRMRPDDGRVVGQFVTQALAGEPLTVHGDGSQTRSFCFVDDLIDGMLLLAAKPAGFSGPVNLGNPEEITVLELARRVLELSGSISPVILTEATADDPRRRCPDIDRARRELGWHPVTDLTTGLLRTIEASRSDSAIIGDDIGP
jgi:UDP-glucuronate decarboxylase